MDMQTVLLASGHPTTGYDLFTWSDNSRAQPVNCIAGIPLLNTELQQLNDSIWAYYSETIAENPGYFTEMEYPFPSGATAIQDDPYLLNSYFEQSDLWADFIMEKLSAWQDWDNMNAAYHLLKFKEVYLQDNIWYLLFYAIDTTRQDAASDFGNTE